MLYKFKFKEGKILLLVGLLILCAPSLMKKTGFGNFRYFFSLTLIGIFIIQSIKIFKLRNRYLEEMKILEEEYKFTLFNTFKNSLVILKTDVIGQLEKDEIFFKNKSSGQLIGIASKKMIVDEKLWKDLMEEIK